MKEFFTLAFSVVFTTVISAQTNPTAQNMPFSVDFGTSTFSTMPAGTAAWNGLNGAAVSTQTAAESTTPTGNSSVTARTTSTTTGGVFGYASAGSNNGRLYIQTSGNSTNGVNQLAAAVILGAGNNTINISYDLEVVLLGDGNRTFGVVLQYRAGTSGSWTTVSGTEVEYTPTSSNDGDADGAGDTDIYSASVSGLTPGTYQFRFAVWRGPSSGGSGSSAGLAFDNLSFTQSGSVPVSLTDFTLSKYSTSTLLTFATATERNNSHFEVERSTDGVTFEKIGEVAGKGNSTGLTNYTFEDKDPLSGVNYYRLRQVDFDGAFEYSAVRSVVFGSTKKVTVFPAPVASVMTVQLDEAFKNDAQWQITDMSGRLVSEGVFAAEQNQMDIPVNGLVEGVYVLRIVAAQETITRQFRKI